MSENQNFKEKVQRTADQLAELGDGAETRSFNIILIVVTRVVKGFFLFKQRKGDLVAGCAAFFTIMSFCPVLLLLISLSGYVFGSVDEAKISVLTSMKNMFPQIAPWIMKSIGEIIDAQLSANKSGFNVMNTLILLYSSLGVVASVMFGIDTISKAESKGGFIIEDVKALAAGCAVYLFMFLLIILNKEKVILGWFGLANDTGFLRDTISFLVKSNILSAGSALGFFTLFYRWAPAITVRWSDSLYGAGTFVTAMLVGKSFYWVYIQYAKEEIARNYGDFDTLIVAVLWIYFLMAAFFLGAGVAYIEAQKRGMGKRQPSRKQDDSPQMPPVNHDGPRKAG